MKVLLIAAFLILPCTVSRAQDFTPKVGLVLSGGGAKGLAHVGVLKLIDSLEIPVDYIAGTSMGGIIGALYAVGYSGVEIEKIVLETSWDELFTDEPERRLRPYLQKRELGRYQISLGLEGFTPIIPSGLISGQKIMMLFSRLTFYSSGINHFDDLPTPFRCIAADLVTGREVVLDAGSLPKAMRATMSIPSIFSPVEWGDSLLIDGGIINNFPVDVVREMGAEVVIGVNVGAPLKKKDELNNILDVFEQAFFMAGEKKIEANISKTEILISPSLTDFTAADFTAKDVREIIKRGENEAYRMMPYLIGLKESYDLPKRRRTKTKQQDRTIHSIFVRGNQSLSFSFIYNYLGVQPGQKINLAILEERITDLYALGYFESVQYDLKNLENGQVVVTLHVREKPFRRLHIGFRYDDFHQLVGSVSVSGTDILVQGLRLENEFQFAGVTRFSLQMYLHSRAFNFPVYPLLQFYFKDDPVNIYDLQGPKIASYKDRSVTIAGGFGVTPHRSFNVSCSFAAEYMKIKPDIALFDPQQFPRFKDQLHQIRVNLNLDTIDDILLPRRGIRAFGYYENSLKQLASDIEYTRFQFSSEIYLSPSAQHTILIAGTLVRTGKNLPIYKAYYFGGPDSFVGLDYGQLITDHAQILRIFYRYEFKKDIFFKIIYNGAYDYRISDISAPAGKILSGYGIAVKFISLIGPLELIYSRSEQSPYQTGGEQSNFYVTAGFQF